MDEISCHHGLQQIINSQSHILPNTASCIDLIFISQHNLIIDCWNRASLLPRCHHQIIFTKINFQVHCPPSYERLIWDYPKANINCIQRSLSQIDGKKSMANLNVYNLPSARTEPLQSFFFLYCICKWNQLEP